MTPVIVPITQKAIALVIAGMVALSAPVVAPKEFTPIAPIVETSKVVQFPIKQEVPKEKAPVAEKKAPVKKKKAPLGEKVQKGIADGVKATGKYAKKAFTLGKKGAVEVYKHFTDMGGDIKW